MQVVQKFCEDLNNVKNVTQKIKVFFVQVDSGSILHKMDAVFDLFFVHFYSLCNMHKNILKNLCKVTKF